MSMNPRLAAAYVIRDVVEGKSLSESLPVNLSKISDGRDKAFTQSLAYNTCRMYTRLDVLLSYLLKKPLPEKEVDVYALLLVGLCQLHVMQMPVHAAVSGTVEAAKGLKKPWAAGLANAILRNYLRKQQDLQTKLQADLEAKYSHPKWMITKIKKAWPQHWHDVLKENNSQAPMVLRINRQKNSRSDYLKLLQTQNIVATVIDDVPDALKLETAIPVNQLPGFTDGLCSVQDAGAQLAALHMDLKPSQLILDACAAPGGKLLHMWEIEPDADYIAIEKDAKRSEKIRDNLLRANALNQPNIKLIIADASELSSWWDKKLFDRILLDAPCSASGVIRRHPDIKILRQPGDIKEMQKQQLSLLNTLWATLKAQGLLLYATCSIFPEENDQVIESFLQAQPEAKLIKNFLNIGIATNFGMQILPGVRDMDGFYYALLQKPKM